MPHTDRPTSNSSPWNAIFSTRKTQNLPFWFFTPPPPWDTHYQISIKYVTLKETNESWSHSCGAIWILHWQEKEFTSEKWDSKPHSKPPNAILGYSKSFWRKIPRTTFDGFECDVDPQLILRIGILRGSLPKMVMKWRSASHLIIIKYHADPHLMTIFEDTNYRGPYAGSIENRQHMHTGNYWMRCRSSQSVQHTATHCDTLQHIAPHCNTSQHTATHCNTSQHTATHCNTLQYTAAHRNTLQHTAKHCNIQQHTAIHCNTFTSIDCYSNTESFSIVNVLPILS